MAGNSLGTIFRLTTFGESHGTAIGGIVDGCPAGLELTQEDIQVQLDRRKPGQSALTTSRNESDTLQLLSGVFEGKTTGTSIGFLIPNKDQRSKDYSNLKDIYRPSHADFTYDKKYGIRDFRGGGRASARETANWVVGGAIAQKVISTAEIKISAYVSQVGTEEFAHNNRFYPEKETDSNAVRCPSEEAAQRMQQFIENVKSEGDSIGGKIQVIIRNASLGLGRPIFKKLHADLAQALFTINAVKAVEFGIGTAAAVKKGSEQNDAFNQIGEKTETTSNNSGGIQGGISNGEDITITITFKPPATILQEQKTIDKAGNNVKFSAEGRHDPCVVPRAVPVVQAMCAMVLADHLLLARTDKI